MSDETRMENTPTTLRFPAVLAVVALGALVGLVLAHVFIAGSGDLGVQGATTALSTALVQALAWWGWRTRDPAERRHWSLWRRLAAHPLLSLWLVVDVALLLAVWATRPGRHLAPAIWRPLTIYIAARALLVGAMLLSPLLRRRRVDTGDADRGPALRFLARMSVAGAPAAVLAIGALVAPRSPLPFAAPVALSSLLLVAGLATLAAPTLGEG